MYLRLMMAALQQSVQLDSDAQLALIVARALLRQMLVFLPFALVIIQSEAKSLPPTVRICWSISGGSK